MSAAKRKADTAAANDAKKAKKDTSLTSFFGAPTVTSASSSTPPEAQGAVPSSFDKEKWVATLNDEQKDLLKLEIDTLHPTWLAALKDELTKPSFLGLKRYLKKEIDIGKKIFPPLPEVYSWSRHTPLNTVKVVILGQDPYHNYNQAHGLCFSVRPPTPAPPSLKNIFQELKSSYPSFTPPPKNGGLLTPWAEQGVLLLNTCLTVRAHEANSHAKQGWEEFTQKVIDVVAKVRTRGVVFLAWGAPAQKRCEKVSGTKHMVLKSVHPSPLSAHKGWFGCGHFPKTNEWLAARYGEDGVINWDLNVQKPIKAPNVQNESIKVAASQKAKTELPVVKNRKPARKSEDFDDEDQDAIDALEEFAKSDAIEPPSQETTVNEKQEEDTPEAKEGNGETQSEGEDKENKSG